MLLGTRDWNLGGERPLQDTSPTQALCGTQFLMLVAFCCILALKDYKMSIVYAVLRNELSRLAALRRKYHEERKLLPVGSVCVKKKSARVYAYLAHRENGRVVQRYLGRDQDPRVGEMRQLVQKRRKFDKEIKGIDVDIKRIRKMLNVR